MSGQRAPADGRRRTSFLAALLVVLGALLAGCNTASGSPPGAAPSTVAGVGTVTTAPDGVQEVTLQTQDDYVFTPDSFTVEPGKVRLTVVNVATQLTHNFRFVPGKGPTEITPEIPLLAPGDKKTIEFTVQRPGDYPFECSFHTQLHQAGVMTAQG
jgi:plastocyanin